MIQNVWLLVFMEVLMILVCPVNNGQDPWTSEFVFWDFHLTMEIFLKNRLHD